MADITKSQPIPAQSALRLPPVALRLWAARGVWLGVVAWGVALAGLSLLGAEPGRTWGMGVLALAAVLGVVAWGPVRPFAGFAPLVRAEPLVRWDLARLIRFVAIGVAGTLLWAAHTVYLAQPDATFDLAGALWLASMGVLVGATLGWPQRAGAAPVAVPPVAATTPALAGIADDA